MESIRSRIFRWKKTFNAVMISGSKTYVREKINYAKFQIGLIDRDTYIKKVSEILTPEEKSPVPPAQMEKGSPPQKAGTQRSKVIIYNKKAAA